MLLSIPLTMMIKIALESYPPTRGFAVLLADEKSVISELEVLRSNQLDMKEPDLSAGSRVDREE